MVHGMNLLLSVDMLGYKIIDLYVKKIYIYNNRLIKCQHRARLVRKCQDLAIGSIMELL